MSARPEDEIRAVRDRLREAAAIRRPKGEMESLAAALMAQALTWALGESESPTQRARKR